MDKRKFIEYFSPRDEKKISFIYDKFQLCHRTGKDILINEFLTFDICNTLERVLEQTDVKLKKWSFYENCEKYLSLFYTDFTEGIFPVSILKISNKSKFHQLYHKDYLGALMSLGIKREKLGDLIVKNDECYVPILDEVSQYIWSNLESIGKNPCTVELLDPCNINIPKPQSEEFIVITTSMRLDCIISALSKVTRNKSCTMIQSGKVFLNYIEETRKDKVIQPNDILTIRGIGKFKVIGECGNTQKDRIKLKISKFL